MNQNLFKPLQFFIFCNEIHNRMNQNVLGGTVGLLLMFLPAAPTFMTNLWGNSAFSGNKLESKAL